MFNGAKLAVASVARATPLFLPRPEIIYINVLHYSALPRTYLLRATPPLCPDWRHCPYYLPNTNLYGNVEDYAGFQTAASCASFKVKYS